MNVKRFKLGGALFLLAGALMIASGLLGKRYSFSVTGCAFIAIGGAFLARAKKVPPA